MPETVVIKVVLKGVKGKEDVVEADVKNGEGMVLAYGEAL